MLGVTLHPHSRKTVALRQLKQIMTRMVKGETAARLGLWRDAQHQSTAAEELRRWDHACTVRGEERVESVSKKAAIRQLRQILTRMVRGEVAMRVAIWRAALREARYL